MKLPELVLNGTHELENAPAGVHFDSRTRELRLGDDMPPGGRYGAVLVGRGDGVEVTMPLTIAADPDAPPTRRRRAAAKK